jgi:hypothetical protein
MRNEKNYTVTMKGTYFVNAKSAQEAERIVEEALYRLSQLDQRVIDTETHWFDAVTLMGGHYTTIVHDGETMSQYDKRLEELRQMRDKEEKENN